MTRSVHFRSGGAGRVGSSLSAEHRMPRFNSLLARVAAKAAKPTEAEKRPERVRKGPATLLTDEQVIEFRIARERDGVSVKELARRFDVSYAYALRLSSYEVRSKLIPKL